MNKLLSVPVMLALLLSACAGGKIAPETPRGYIGFFVKHPNPNLPNIVVEDDSYLIVDQEPIHIKLKQNNNPVIVFRLELGTPYVFADNPIKITPVGSSPKLTGLDCPVQGSGSGQQVLVCTYDDPTMKGKYTYTLSVKNSGTGKVLTLDPTIMND